MSFGFTIPSPKSRSQRVLLDIMPRVKADRRLAGELMKVSLRITARGATRQLCRTNKQF